MTREAKTFQAAYPLCLNISQTRANFSYTHVKGVRISQISNYSFN